MIVRAMQPFKYTARFARHVIPLVGREMDRWERIARDIPTKPLREQALASLGMKRFHAEGGNVFAAAEPTVAEKLVPLIVALQTISDYLDNLGDRTESLSERDFRSLHQAMLDAVSTTSPRSDYYAYHPHQDDGGYLEALVTECQRCIAQLPDYGLVEAEVQRQLQRYCDLQVYKHLPLDQREDRLIDWHTEHAEEALGLPWWEFGAACGSTLGVFALFLEAAVGTTEQRVEQIAQVYFPWICAVHILLDYLIDQEEDRREGDLNFVSYYPEADAALRGMRLLIREGATQLRQLDDAPFHAAVLEGLLGLYLTDSKVRQQGLRTFAFQLIRASSVRTWIVYWYCLLWRRKHRRNDR